jgi:hypothetical protein
MSQERVSRLVEIGFQWAIKGPRFVPWKTRYDELVAFIVCIRRDQICLLFPVSNLSSSSFLIYRRKNMAMHRFQ